MTKSETTDVSVKVRRRPRFKAGSDLSGKVNKVAIDFNEEIDETSEILELKIHLSSAPCLGGNSDEE